MSGGRLVFDIADNFRTCKKSWHEVSGKTLVLWIVHKTEHGIESN